MLFRNRGKMLQKWKARAAPESLQTAVFFLQLETKKFSFLSNCHFIIVIITIISSGTSTNSTTSLTPPPNSLLKPPGHINNAPSLQNPLSIMLLIPLLIGQKTTEKSTVRETVNRSTLFQVKGMVIIVKNLHALFGTNLLNNVIVENENFLSKNLMMPWMKPRIQMNGWRTSWMPWRTRGYTIQMDIREGGQNSYC